MQTLNNGSPVAVNLKDLASPTKECPIRVLHVDDDPCMLEISKLVLMDVGNFEIDSVCCVDEAFKKLETGNYDVVVSDFEMPKKDGLEFLRELRDAKNDVPFILFTGKGREEVAVKALNLGADAYLNKQGNPETVYGELAHYIRLFAEKNLTAKRLKKQEEMLLKISAQSSGMLYQFKMNTDGIFSVPFSSEAIKKIFGCSPEDVESDFSPITKAIYPKDLDKVINSIKFSAENLTPWVCEYRVQIPGKPVKWMLGKSVPEKQEDGSIVWNGYNVDITEQKEAEEILRLSEVTYRRLLNGMNDTAWVIDFDGNFVEVNDSAIRVLGYSKKELISLGIRGIDKNLSQKQVQNLINQLPKVGSQVFETVHTTKDGKEIPVEICSSLVTYQGKQAILSVARNLTERKKTEEALNYERDFSRVLLENMDAGVVACNTEGKLVLFNRVAREWHGLDPLKIPQSEWASYYGLFLEDGVTPMDERTVPLARAFRGEVIKDVGMVIAAKGKPKRQITANCSPVRDKDGKLLGAVAIMHEIAESKKAEDALRKSELKYRNIVELSPDGIITITMNGTITSVNQAFADLTGFSKDEIVGMDLTQLGTQLTKGIGKYKKLFTSFLLGEIPERYEFEFFRKDGVRRFGDARIAFIKEDAKKIGVQAVLRDITERKEAETKLKLSEQRYREFADSLPEIVFETDEKGLPVFVNRKAEEITGFSVDEIKQRNFLQFLAPQDRQRAEENVQRRFEGKKTGANQYSILKKDGTLFPAMIFTESISTKTSEPGLRGIIINLSEVKKIEEELKNHKNKLELMNEKLSVVGGLTRHDVGNKLMVARTNAYLLEKRIGDNPEVRKYIEGINSAISQSDQIFEFSRVYEKIGSQKLETIDVGESFDDAAKLFPNLCDIKVINDCRGLNVIADSLLIQLFYNFMDNSLKHGEKVTQIKLHFKKGKDNILLFYEDDGVGISESNKPKMFSEGFTTGKGSGRGLKLIKRMLDVYGWSITEEGIFGEGAKFVITIPSR